MTSDHYKLNEKIDAKGNLYVQVEKGMYDLAQAGKIANKLLEQRLKDFACTQLTITPRFWKHN